MRYFSLSQPNDSIEIYAHNQNINSFNRARTSESVSGKIYYGEEDHFDSNGNLQKFYGIGIFYNALYVPVEKAEIIVDKLTKSKVEFYTSRILTDQGEYIAFRTLNVYKPDDCAPMCRMPYHKDPSRLDVKQYYSEEFLDFLGEHFSMENFSRINTYENSQIIIQRLIEEARKSAN